MDAQGYSRLSIDNSDAAIRSAIAIELRRKPYETLIVSDKPCGRSDAATNKPKSVLWSQFALFATSALLAFYIAPGATQEEDLSRILTTATMLSAVTLLLGALFLRLRRARSSQVFSTAIILALAPSYVLGVSVVERNRIESSFVVPMVLTEFGLRALPNAILGVFYQRELAKTSKQTTVLAEDEWDAAAAADKMIATIMGENPAVQKTSPARPKRVQQEKASQSASLNSSLPDDRNAVYATMLVHRMYLEDACSQSGRPFSLATNIECVILERRQIYFLRHTCNEGMRRSNVYHDYIAILMRFTSGEQVGVEQLKYELARYPQFFSASRAGEMDRGIARMQAAHRASAGGAYEHIQRPIYWDNLQEMRDAMSRFGCPMDNADEGNLFFPDGVKGLSR